MFTLSGRVIPYYPIHTSHSALLWSRTIVSMLLSMGQNHGGGVALASGSSPTQLFEWPSTGE